jgi:hypothetical protein
MHFAELHDLYSLPNVIVKIIFKRMRQMGHVAHMGDMINVYKISIVEPEGKRPLRRPRHRWKDTSKVDFKEVKCEGCGLYRIYLGSGPVVGSYEHANEPLG